MFDLANFGLKLLDPLTTPAAKNYCLTSWPPQSDSPVTLDANGEVLSRFNSPFWDLSYHCNRAVRLHFRDAPADPGRRLDPKNGNLFRICLGWWWWGPQAVVKPSELEARFRALRPIFEICFKNKITADRFHRFPKLIDSFQRRLKPSQARTVIRLLHDIYEARDELGFFLLSREQIVALYRQTPTHTKVQTPYIPPRIWQHLANRTSQFITEFLGLADDFSKLFTANVEESIGETPHHSVDPESYPELSLSMERWIHNYLNATSRTRISSYASLVVLTCHVQIVLCSLMRVDEAWCLPIDCFRTEKDAVGEFVFSVRGDTSKTLVDDDARWIVPASVEEAVRAASKVAFLRLRAGQLTEVLGPEANNPQAPLFPRSYEPWAGRMSLHRRSLTVRPAAQELKRELRRFKLIEEAESVVTEDDMAVSRLLNPMANADIISVGRPWSLAWHQLRRTGAVNMLSSGLVSDASLQYQLKHTNAAMSRYYGRGHYLLSSRVNEGARQEYVRTMYESLARDFAKLKDERFVSPYGPEHKLHILKLTSPADHRHLLKEAKKGSIAYREHLLGGCANPSPCNKGGYESVAPCGGRGKPCEWLLYDKEKLPKYKALLIDIQVRQKAAVPSEPLREALDGQALDVRAAIEACEN